MAEFDDDAVVLDTTPYQDRHQIVAILTAGHGLVRGVLRGARGGKAPAAAATQVLSLVRATWWLKASAELASFRRIELLRSSFPLSSDFEASIAGAAIAELFLSFCSPGEPHPRHFRLAGSATKAILDGKNPAALLAYVATWILRLGGVLPELGACSECGATLEDGLHLDPAGFLPLCPTCAPADAPRLDPASVRFLRTVLRTPPDALRGPPPPGAVRWLDRRIRDEAHRPLRALDFFRRHAATP